jgi:hypothetical protein
MAEIKVEGAWWSAVFQGFLAGPMAGQFQRFSHRRAGLGPAALPRRRGVRPSSGQTAHRAVDKLVDNALPLPVERGICAGRRGLPTK